MSGSAIGKALKITLLVYLSGFLLVTAHFPRGVTQLASSADPETLVVPAYAPAIVRAYGQFAYAQAWPFGLTDNAVRISDLIEEHGVERFPGIRSVTVNMTPRIDPGRGGYQIYELGLESYMATDRGAAMTIRGGNVLRIGQYFCLVDSHRKPFERLNAQSECSRLIVREGSQYFWQKLGEREMRAVSLLSNERR